MKKITGFLLLMIFGMPFLSYANLTNGIIPVAKNGSSNPPTVQDGSIYDTGTPGNPGPVGIGAPAVTGDSLYVPGSVAAQNYNTPNGKGGFIGSSGWGITPGNGPLTFFVYPSGNIDINTSGTPATDPGITLTVGGSMTATADTITGSQTDYVHIPGEETIPSATSITPSGSYSITYQANTGGSGTLTINAPTNTPAEGQSWELILKCTNSQTFSWNAVFNTGGLTLPTTTTGSSKYDDYSFQYNSHSGKYNFMGSSTGN